jgi:hypothetical protein
MDAKIETPLTKTAVWCETHASHEGQVLRTWAIGEPETSNS